MTTDRRKRQQNNAKLRAEFAAQIAADSNVDLQGASRYQAARINHVLDLLEDRLDPAAFATVLSVVTARCPKSDQRAASKHFALVADQLELYAVRFGLALMAASLRSK